MARKPPLHRSVSFTTDVDPLSNYFNCTPGRKSSNSSHIKITMSHSEDIHAKVSGDSMISQTRPKVHLRPRRPSKVLTGTVTYLTCLALMTEVFALVPFIIAYAAPYWMQVSDPMGLTYSGLWRLCAYTYCEYFAGHPMYTWFHTVQVCSSLALVCQIFSLICSCIYAFSSGCLKYKPHLIWSAATALILADVFQLSGVLLYGIYQGADPDTLSWAFIMAAVSTGLTVLPVVFLLLEALHLFRRKPSKHSVFRRSISEASITFKDSTSSNTPNQGIPKKSSEESLNNRVNNQMTVVKERTSSIRMRVNSCSALLNDMPEIPDADNNDLDTSVFD